jgi:mTERF domain-containing protein
MLRLQSHLLRAASPLHRFHFSTAAAAASATPAQFVVDDYLVASCGLAPAQARRASKYLRHLKSPAKPDAVRAFLSDAGIVKADIASAIATFPRILCSSVDKTLTPRIAQLLDMGLSPPQISRLSALAPTIFVSPVRISRLAFYLSLLGSYDKVEAAIKCNFFLLSRNTHTVELNIAFLQQCGLTCDDIADLYAHGRTNNLLCNSLEHVKKMVAHAEKLGVRPCSPMFKRALLTVCNQSPESASARMELLERALGYSEAKLAVCRLPSILSLSEVTLNHKVKFLTTEFGLEPSYIAQRPAILCYSLEKRLIPRHYAIHILKAKGLIKGDIDLFNVFCCSHDKFVECYLHRQ